MQLFTRMELGAAVLGVWDFGSWGGWVGGLVGTWRIKVACKNWIPNFGCHLCFGEKCFFCLFLLCFWCLSRHVATMTYLCCVWSFHLSLLWAGCVTQPQYHSTFSGLVIIKLLLLLIFFAVFGGKLSVWKCWNLRRLLGTLQRKGVEKYNQKKKIDFHLC
jgi:hypothetical protein